MFKWLFGRKDGGGDISESRELLSLTQTVNVPAAKAFEVFIDRINDWWPRDYTWGQDRLDAMVIEPKMGGRAYERTKDGQVSVWGTVLTVSRPNHIVIAWQIKPDRAPEPEEGASSRLDLHFVDKPEGKAEVILVHRDFPRHGDGWEKYKASMAAKNGWPRLMDLYLKAVGGST